MSLIKRIYGNKGTFRFKLCKISKECLFDKNITVGIVNMKVDETDIQKSYEYLGQNSNISFKRQSRLYSILNLAEKHKVNLLIFPEYLRWCYDISRGEKWIRTPPMPAPRLRLERASRP